MGDFTLLESPTDAVTSVNGSTGVVSLTHDGFSDFVTNEHIDWTSSSAGTIHSTNYTNTTYSVQDGQLSQNNFTDTLKSKLDNIASSANNYSLPISTASVLGGVKVGSGLSINAGTGVLSTSGGSVTEGTVIALAIAL